MSDDHQGPAELATGQTVETVSPAVSAPGTPLKRGVNKNRHEGEVFCATLACPLP